MAVLRFEKEEEETEGDQFGSFDKFHFGTSAMIASIFEALRGYRTLAYTGQVHIKPYNCCFSRVFQASICIAIPTYRDYLL